MLVASDWSAGDGPVAVLRHAKAEQTFGVLDHERELTDRGRRDAHAVGEWLAAQEIDADLVICSTAIKADHPERQAAVDAGLPVLSRAEALAGLTRLRPTIAVSGTHGKTTSTAMLALAMRSAGANVSWLVGSTVPALGSPAHWGDGDWFVVEADESDDTHLALARTAVLLTNAEGEHLDFHGTLGRVIDGYVEFLTGNPADAATSPTVRVAGLDDHGAALVAKAVGGVVTFGTTPGTDWWLEVLTEAVTGTTSMLTSPSGDRIALRLAVPGDHNARNAAGVVALVGELGFDPTWPPPELHHSPAPADVSSIAARSAASASSTTTHITPPRSPPRWLPRRVGTVAAWWPFFSPISTAARSVWPSTLGPRSPPPTWWW